MPNKGAKASRYQVGGFELTVFDQAYLVEVKTAPSNPAEPHLISGLPEWVFLPVTLSGLPTMRRIWRIEIGKAIRLSNP